MVSEGGSKRVGQGFLASLSRRFGAFRHDSQVARINEDSVPTPSAAFLHHLHFFKYSHGIRDSGLAQMEFFRGGRNCQVRLSLEKLVYEYGRAPDAAKVFDAAPVALE
jgi:hypothetical protein